jgi:hypothetical protein
VRFVVWPAAYDEVIAVAACNVRRQTWRGSCRGAAVDVTAPGESVWCARVDRTATPPAHDSARSSGTSYAVATVAGIAALWLARHGPDNLARRYGAEKIPFIFNRLLRDTCVKVDDPSWEPGSFGAGLVDAEALLAAPLPAEPLAGGLERAIEAPMMAPALALEEHVPLDTGGAATFAHLFERSLASSPLERGFGAPPSSDAVLRQRLAELLNTTAADLPSRLSEVGQELAFYFAVNPEMHREFSAALEAAQLGPDAGPLERALPEAGVAAARSSLLAEGVSPALGDRLGGIG